MWFYAVHSLLWSEPPIAPLTPWQLNGLVEQEEPPTMLMGRSLEIFFRWSGAFRIPNAFGGEEWVLLVFTFLSFYDDSSKRGYDTKYGLLEWQPKPVEHNFFEEPRWLGRGKCFAIFRHTWQRYSMALWLQKFFTRHEFLPRAFWWFELLKFSCTSHLEV